MRMEEEKTVEAQEVYRLNPVVAIEDFGNRSLALHCEDLRLIELNATARDIIARLNGQASLQQVALGMAHDYHQPLEVILEDMQAVIARMVDLDVVEWVGQGVGSGTCPQSSGACRASAAF